MNFHISNLHLRYILKNKFHSYLPSITGYYMLIYIPMQNASGVDWSLICNLMVSQCFWGILPLPQIMHFFAICVLFSPDYIIYYCVSLLYHCQFSIMESTTNGKLWPEHMVCVITHIKYNAYILYNLSMLFI